MSSSSEGIILLPGDGCTEIIEKSHKNEVEKLLLEISARHDVAGYVKWFLT